MPRSSAGLFHVVVAAAIAYAATTGPAPAMDLAETALKKAAFVLARACVAHFQKTGDVTRHAQVNFRKSGIVRLRDQALVTTALVRGLASVARTATGAAGRALFWRGANSRRGRQGKGQGVGGFYQKRRATAGTSWSSPAPVSPRGSFHTAGEAGYQ